MYLEKFDIDGIHLGIYKDGPVGIGLSGGADSAVLLYILMSKIKHTIHIYNMWSSSRKSVFAKNVDNVIKTCSQLTGNTNYLVHKIQVEPDESIEFYCTMLTGALDKKEVDIIYLGITNFPPEEIYLKFNQQLEEWHNTFRSDKVLHPLFGMTVKEGQANTSYLDERTYIPFRNHNKKDIANIFKKFNLEKTLLPVTRSCEDDNHPDSHCGKCWWCQERIWAFGNLGE